MSLAIMSFRIGWFVSKDFITKSLMKRESQRSSVHSSKTPSSQDKRPKRMKCCSKTDYTALFVERFLAVVLKYVNLQVFLAMIISPIIILTAVEAYLFIVGMGDMIINESIWKKACASSAFSIMVRIQATIYAYIGNNIFWVFSTFFQLQDNLGFGNEMRALVIFLFLTFCVLLISLIVEDGFFLLFVQTKVWILLIGGIFAPCSVLIQGMYPVYLSVKNQKNLERDKKKKPFTKTLVMATQTLDGAVLQGSASAGDRFERVSSNSFHEHLSPSKHTLQEEFEDLLKTPHGRNEFLSYLESEFAVENLLFFEAARDFHNKYSGKITKFKAGDDAFLEALEICETFIKASAPSAVNLPHEMRKAILAGFPLTKALRASAFEESFSVDLFERAKLETFKLMMSDSYPRFVNLKKPDRLLESTVSLT
eukprot:TRINITY_DN32079_c0_g1_i1.p1 TRINITY_DN32079_c0_g1~~TRINITY_DN32079_c0_g1_i1.p1  ORF type:complete len:447 (+),score=95.60 TRINITY_DN32079_c0_g1_i1:70-1341(+)